MALDCASSHVIIGQVDCGLEVEQVGCWCSELVSVGPYWWKTPSWLPRMQGPSEGSQLEVHWGLTSMGWQTRWMVAGEWVVRMRWWEWAARPMISHYYKLVLNIACSEKWAGLHAGNTTQWIQSDNIVRTLTTGADGKLPESFTNGSTEYILSHRLNKGVRQATWAVSGPSWLSD